MKSLFFILSGLFLTTASFARPVLDQSVKNFIENQTTETETHLRVLVRYQVPILNSQLKGINFQKDLIKQTNQFEKNIFSNLHTFTNTMNKVSLWLVQGTLVTLSVQDLNRLANSNKIASITDASRSAHLIFADSHRVNSWRGLGSIDYTYGLEKIKIPELVQKYPDLNGQNIKVGIIDTGIEANHPDLKNKVILFKDFIRVNQAGAYDDHGHGTHVAGTIAGGHSSGQAIGVAPQAQLIIAKAFSSLGNSTDEGLLKSLQWMTDPDNNPDTFDFPRVISNSWNIDDSSFSKKEPLEEPFCVLVQNLNRLGIAVVFAAGNDGPQSSSVSLPGACPEAITVGATTDSDRIASFSSRGPVQWKSQSIVKPDISAPGKDIDSADLGGDYRTRSGTSMATPHIAGVLALLYQAKPEMSVEEAKNYLYSGAQDLGVAGLDPVFGFGRADVLSSVELIKK